MKLVDSNRNLRWVCAECRGDRSRADEPPVHKCHRCTLCGARCSTSTGGSFVQFRTMQQHGDYVSRRVSELTAPGVTARCSECGGLGLGSEMGIPPMCDSCYDASEDGLLWAVKIWLGRLRRWRGGH